MLERRQEHALHLLDRHIAVRRPLWLAGGPLGPLTPNPQLNSHMRARQRSHTASVLTGPPFDAAEQRFTVSAHGRSLASPAPEV